MVLLLSLVLCGCGDKLTPGDSAVDRDGDGWTEAEDCDDADAGLHPENAEVCDGVDQDCDGVVDEGQGGTYYADVDGDGYGDPDASTQACTIPDGYTADSDDCDDSSAQVRPGGTETCDMLDNDCDTLVDEGLGDQLEVWFLDSDGDGYGDPDVFVVACEAPEGHVANDQDCDDGDAERYPDAEDIPEDGVDQDCDGEDALLITDADEDGYDDDVDCDDADPEVNPGAAELCDGIDNDCDEDVDEPWFDSDLTDAVDPAVITLNGTASQAWDGADGYIELTAAAASQVGSMYFNQLRPADLWVAKFTITVGGGDGADGMAFAFLDETDPTLLGVNGGQLGLKGFSGYALEFDSYYNADHGDPTSADHCALIDTSAFGVQWYTSCNFRNLGAIPVELHMDSGDWTIFMSGGLLASGTLAGYALDQVMFGFTGATGAITDQHTVDDIWLGCPE